MQFSAYCAWKQLQTTTTAYFVEILAFYILIAIYMYNVVTKVLDWDVEMYQYQIEYGTNGVEKWRN